MYKRPGNGGSSSDTNGMYRSGPGGYGRSDVESGRGSGRTARETNASIMEQQNNERISELSEHVAMLKGLTNDIHSEVRDQNNFLDTLQDGFYNTQDMLQGSLVRIGTMLEQGGIKKLCYMAGFIVFVVTFLYWVITYKGKSGA